MKKMLQTLVFVGFLVFIAASADAGSTLFQTGYMRLMHENYYAWNLSPNFSKDEVIVGAVLTYHDLYDASYSTEDRLFTHLMDNFEVSGNDRGAQDGVISIFGEIPAVPASDAWAGNGSLLQPIHEPVYGLVETVTYDIGALGLVGQLNAFYQNDGKFSIGIDPDCHFTAADITLEIITSAVPAPGSVLLGCVGIAFVGWLRRRSTLRES